MIDISLRQITKRLFQKHELSQEDSAALVKSLVDINMNSIAYNVMSGRKSTSDGAAILDSVLQTAMSLEQWDVRVPDTANSDVSTLYSVFQSINNATTVDTIRKDLDAGFLQTMRGMLIPSAMERTMGSRLATLRILSEVDDMVTAQSTEHFVEADV